MKKKDLKKNCLSKILWGKKINFLFTIPHLSPWAILAPWLNKKYKKNKFTTHLEQKNSLWAHMEMEFDVFGIVEKLAKYVVHCSRKKLKKIVSLLIGCPKNKQFVFL